MTIRILASLAFFLCMNANAFASEQKLFTDWIEEMSPSSNAQDEARKFLISGITPNDDGFYLLDISTGLQKRSLKTGDIIWSCSLKSSSQSTWALNGNSLYGGDTKGNIYRVNAKTGRIIWTNQSKGILFSRPVVKADQMWLVNSYGNLESYRSSDGQWLWQQSDSETTNLGLWSYQGPIFFSQWIVTGFPSGVLQAFEPTTGKRIWSESFHSAVEENIGLNDLKAIASSKDYLMASSFSGNVKTWKISGGSKALAWEKRLSLQTPPVISADQRLVYISDRTGYVQAIDLTTGYVKWQYEVPSGLASSVSIGDSTIWFGTTEGQLVVLDKSGKLIIKSENYGVPIYNSPILLSDTSSIFITSRGILRRVYFTQIKS